MSLYLECLCIATIAACITGIALCVAATIQHRRKRIDKEYIARRNRTENEHR